MGEVFNALDELEATSTPLGASEEFMGDTIPVAGYGRIVGSVFADQAGTLFVEQSADGVNWDISDEVAVAATTGVGFSVEVKAPFGRIRYLNGAVAQTVFRLSSYLRRL